MFSESRLSSMDQIRLIKLLKQTRIKDTGQEILMQYKFKINLYHFVYVFKKERCKIFRRV